LFVLFNELVNTTDGLSIVKQGLLHSIADAVVVLVFVLKQGPVDVKHGIRSPNL